MNKQQYIFYMHGGSENHGCEAIVRSSAKILTNYPILFSNAIKQDEKYGLSQVADLKNVAKPNKYSLPYFKFYLQKKLNQSTEKFYQKIYHCLLEQESQLCFSIGGDNYCYNDSPKELAYVNSKLKDKNNKTILWACSIEPNLITQSDIIKDLNQYDCIFARESITYNALLHSDIRTKVFIYPDPAFTLSYKPLNIENSYHEEIIGINMSPLVQLKNGNPKLVFENYKKLIEHILDSSRNKILLIPHVVWENSNDISPLSLLYKEYKNTKRISLINDGNCMELKSSIAQCRFFIGARTHATIAAYSTCVPTLVVGYSVKSKGIAKDIFGTDENYVIPVQSLRHEDDLTKAFQWLMGHEDEIRTHLKTFMPSYISKAWEAGKKIKELFDTGEK